MNPKNSPYYTYIKPLIKNPYVKNYSGIAFAVVTIIIFGFFAIRPTISVIISLQKSIDSQKTILQSLSSKSQTLETARANHQNLNSQTIAKMNGMLPSNTNLAPLIEYLNSLANVTDASISALQFQPVPLTANNNSTSTSIQEVDFTFNLQGSYSAFQYIIQNITRGPRIVDIQNLNLSRTNDNTLILSINAKAYFLNQK